MSKLAHGRRPPHARDLPPCSVELLSLPLPSPQICGVPGDQSCKEAACGGALCRDGAGTRRCGGTGCTGALPVSVRALSNARNTSLQLEVALGQLGVVAQKVGVVAPRHFLLSPCTVHTPSATCMSFWATAALPCAPYLCPLVCPFCGPSYPVARPIPRVPCTPSCPFAHPVTIMSPCMSPHTPCPPHCVPSLVLPHIPHSAPCSPDAGGAGAGAGGAELGRGGAGAVTGCPQPLREGDSSAAGLHPPNQGFPGR